MKYDWHGYGLKIIRKEAAIKESQISEKNKKKPFLTSRSSEKYSSVAHGRWQKTSFFFFFKCFSN